MSRKINVNEPGEQAPSDNIECPEECVHCPPSRSYEDCSMSRECIFGVDAATQDKSIHREDE